MNITPVSLRFNTAVSFRGQGTVRPAQRGGAPIQPLKHIPERTEKGAQPKGQYVYLTDPFKVKEEAAAQEGKQKSGKVKKAIMGGLTAAAVVGGTAALLTGCSNNNEPMPTTNTVETKNPNEEPLTIFTKNGAPMILDFQPEGFKEFTLESRTPVLDLHKFDVIDAYKQDGFSFNSIIKNEYGDNMKENELDSINAKMFLMKINDQNPGLLDRLGKILKGDSWTSWENLEGKELEEFMATKWNEVLGKAGLDFTEVFGKQLEMPEITFDLYGEKPSNSKMSNKEYSPSVQTIYIDPSMKESDGVVLEKEEMNGKENTVARASSLQAAVNYAYGIDKEDGLATQAAIERLCENPTNRMLLCYTTVNDSVSEVLSHKELIRLAVPQEQLVILTNGSLKGSSEIKHSQYSEPYVPQQFENINLKNYDSMEALVRDLYRDHEGNEFGNDSKSLHTIRLLAEALELSYSTGTGKSLKDAIGTNAALDEAAVIQLDLQEGEGEVNPDTIPDEPETKPTDPKPTDPKPTDPKPTDPKPTDPKPTDPTDPTGQECDPEPPVPADTGKPEVPYTQPGIWFTPEPTEPGTTSTTEYIPYTTELPTEPETSSYATEPSGCYDEPPVDPDLHRNISGSRVHLNRQGKRQPTQPQLNGASFSPQARKAASTAVNNALRGGRR